MQTSSIQQVLADLDAITHRSLTTGSRLGFVAALERGVTTRVAEGIARGRFQDGARMERLDVVFASGHLEPLERWSEGGPVTEAWRLAFEAAGRWRSLVVQHLLLGMNAHINLDLGIAAAQVCPGGALPPLERGFWEVNAVLAEELDHVQRRLGKVSRA